jgi:LuxR family maltose regulon positive regulatory protein
VYLKQGRLAKAQDWARARGLSADDEISYLGEFEHLTLVRVLMAEVQSRQDGRSLAQAMQASGLLERLLKAAEAQSRTGSVLEILVTQALAHHAQANLSLALASLERALTLAEPEGYVRLFVNEGEPMRLLIEKQSRNRDHPLSDYVDKLLAAFTQPLDAPNPVYPGRVRAFIHTCTCRRCKCQESEMIEPLSERELEVLKLLRTELSGPDIASQLIVSPNTFRTHTKDIFNKLGVNNRRAAVRRAEELDLF